jgi:hypothetical protein
MKSQLRSGWSKAAAPEVTAIGRVMPCACSHVVTHCRRAYIQRLREGFEEKGE